MRRRPDSPPGNAIDELQGLADRERLDAPLPLTDPQDPRQVRPNLPSFRRGDFDPRPPQIPSGEQAYIGRQRGPADLAPKRLPEIEASVRSTYDVRPVNARDFYIESSAEISVLGTPGIMTVPPIMVTERRVAIVRGVRFSLEPLPALGTFTDYRFTLLRNQIPVDDYVNLSLGPEIEDLLPTFVIVGPGISYGLQISTTQALGLVTLYAWFYGNLLMQTDVTPELQIANPMRLDKGGSV